VGHTVAPETPVARLDGSVVRWNEVPGAVSYTIVHNGIPVAHTRTPSYTPASAALQGEYQTAANNAAGSRSFLSEPVAVFPAGTVVTVNASGAPDAFIELDKKNPHTGSIRVDVPRDGLYAVDVEYANGSGPINTDNKCAVRTAVIDGAAVGPIVMPQRGDGSWKEYGYSSTVTARLGRGVHEIVLAFRPSDENMNGEINTARVRTIRFTLVHTNGPKK